MRNDRKKSLLYKTGQAWKFWIGVYGNLFLIIFAILAFWYGEIFILIGITVFSLCQVYAFISIRCSTCGARWYWLAINEKHEDGWYKWLFSQKVCAVCGADENGKK